MYPFSKILGWPYKVRVAISVVPTLMTYIIGPKVRLFCEIKNPIRPLRWILSCKDQEIGRFLGVMRCSCIAVARCCWCGVWNVCMVVEETAEGTIFVSLKRQQARFVRETTGVSEESLLQGFLFDRGWYVAILSLVNQIGCVSRFFAFWESHSRARWIAANLLNSKLHPYSLGSWNRRLGGKL